MTPQPSDQEFLQAIFGVAAPFAHVTSFPDDPSAIVDRGRCWGGGWFKDTHIDPRNNNYFTISIFEQPRRRKDYFIATHLIVADDVSEKIPVENANLLPPPTYKLQSSNGSEQWGWVLDTPCYDRGMVENLLNGLIVQGLAPAGVDPGMKGVTRYIRLPNSKNTKASRVAENGGIPPAVHLTEWHPERKTSIEFLAAPFNIDIHAPVRKESDSKAIDLPDHPMIEMINKGVVHVKEKLGPG